MQRSPTSAGAIHPGLLTTVIVLASATAAIAQTTPRGEDLFEIHVRPTLVAHCIECHGDTEQEGGLQLVSLQSLVNGGDSGPAIVPGHPDESLLVEALRYESFEMPPSGPLDTATVDGIARWIAAGAPWPEGEVLRTTHKIAPEDRLWWCYQSIADPEVPDVDDDGWCRNEIDHFVWARLAAEGIEPSAEATPLDLVRRVHFAITGLPPDEPTVAAAIDGQESYEQLVDRLLCDPAYGENQAR